MRVVKINSTKVKIFQKKELIEKLNFTEDEAKIIMKYQKTFPELLQDGIEGFVIDARILWKQLKVKRQFGNWIKDKIEQYNYIENIDFTSFNKNVKREIGGTQIKDYYFTIECAKKISIRQNNEMGNLVCNYFILMEKALRNYEYWTMVREPQKEGYIKLSKTLDENYKLSHEGEKAHNYIYSNEADMINRALLGDSAKNINALLDNKDKCTREHLNTEINKTINELETMDMALVMAGLDYESRKKTIANICNTKYSGISFEIKGLKEAL